MMGSEAYLRELEALLSDIPIEEREEALEFYRSYFEEAEGNEEQVIADLGAPQKVAADIRQGIAGNGNGPSAAEAGGEYTERGFYSGEEVQADTMMEKSTSSGKNYEKSIRGYWNRLRDWFISQNQLVKLIILACVIIFVLPVVGTLLSGITGIALGILGLLLGVFAGVFGLLIGGYAGGAGLLVTGVVKLMSTPAVGMLMCGIGLLGIACGILMTLLLVWMIKTVIPWAVRGIVAFFQKLFRGGSAI